LGLSDEEDYILPDEVAQKLRMMGIQPTTDQDFYQMMGQTYFIVKDRDVTALMMEDPDLRELYPTLSHLVRTANQDKNTIKEEKLRWRRSCILQLLVKKKPNLQSQAKYDAWVNFGDACFEDTKDGWRGRLFTERIRTYRIEDARQKKKRFLGF